MQYIDKDITTVEAPAVIIHGVNCKKVMGAGVAKALCIKYPKVKSMYLRIAQTLGAIQPVCVGDNLFVINCFTTYGRIETPASPSAIYQALVSVMRFAIHTGITTVYSPKIGCGLGGLNWERNVEPIYNDIQKMFPEVEILICEL